MLGSREIERDCHMILRSPFEFRLPSTFGRISHNLSKKLNPIYAVVFRVLSLSVESSPIYFMIILRENLIRF